MRNQMQTIRSINGMVMGRINKELKEICLLDQVYVKAEDGKKQAAGWQIRRERCERKTMQRSRSKVLFVGRPARESRREKRTLLRKSQNRWQEIERILNPKYIYNEVSETRGNNTHGFCLNCEMIRR